MRRRETQSGAALLLAIFVLVAGAAIAAALARMLGSAAQGTGLLLAGQRAQFAARAGLEWARYSIDQTSACASGVLTLGASSGALTGYSITVSCQRTTHSDGGTARVVYALGAFAQYASYGSPDYASARLLQTLVR